MSSVEIYTAMFCPFCSQVKSLLKNKGVKFKEIDVTSDLKGRKEMSRKSGGATSVPQVFINGRHIGDCDFIHRLDATGKLDPLLLP